MYSFGVRVLVLAHVLICFKLTYLSLYLWYLGCPAGQLQMFLFHFVQQVVQNVSHVLRVFCGQEQVASFSEIVSIIVIDLVLNEQSNIICNYSLSSS